jgi:transcriptional regulator
MYNPPHFEETRPEILRDLIVAHPLGALVTLGSKGLDANHIPFEFAAGDGPHGTLRGHVARSNPVWKDFSREVEVLVIFQGPSAYITPSWYETKKETGKVVPTYNYCTVHVHGPLVIHDDREWLRGMVTRLTQRFESTRPAPWAVADAPTDFIDKQLGAIVGIEIPIARIVGKWKVSQNRPAADRPTIEAGLRARSSPAASAMADLVRDFGKPNAL